MNSRLLTLGLYCLVYAASQNYVDLKLATAKNKRAIADQLVSSSAGLQ